MQPNTTPERQPTPPQNPPVANGLPTAPTEEPRDNQYPPVSPAPPVVTHTQPVSTAPPVAAHTPPVPSHPSPVPHAPTVSSDGPKSRLAMMLFAFFALPTGLAKAYIGDRSGLVRFWVYVGAQILAIIPILGLLAVPVLLILSIWGLVDFFSLKSRMSDTAGKPLHSTPRDEKIVGHLYILMTIMVAIFVVSFVSMLFFLSSLISGFGEAFSQLDIGSTPTTNSY